MHVFSTSISSMPSAAPCVGKSVSHRIFSCASHLHVHARTFRGSAHQNHRHRRHARQARVVMRDARPRRRDGEFLLHVEGDHSLELVWHMHVCTPRLRDASDVRACVFARGIGARRSKQVHVLDPRVCAWRGPSDEHADVPCIVGCCDARRDEGISPPISHMVDE